MQRLPLVFLLLFVSGIAAAQHSLVKKWESDSLFRTPESVLYSEKDKLLYVANMDPDHPGKGGIAKLGLDGKIVSADWVTGLSSPKGMGIYRNLLYVAELTDVAVIDIAKGTIVKRIAIEGAAFLNDITVDKKGVVYVSDSKTMKVHRIENDRPVTVLQNLQGPNGVLAVGDALLVLDKGGLVKMLSSGQVVSITGGMDPTTDGIEQVKKDEYIISSWNGVVYYLDANGYRQTLLDTRPQKINSADIGYDPKSRMLYVPTFFRNTVAAYELN